MLVVAPELAVIFAPVAPAPNTIPRAALPEPAKVKVPPVLVKLAKLVKLRPTLVEPAVMLLVEPVKLVVLPAEVLKVVLLAKSIPIPRFEEPTTVMLPAKVRLPEVNSTPVAF